MRAHWAWSSRSERVLGMRYPFGFSRNANRSGPTRKEPTASIQVVFIAESSDAPIGKGNFDGAQGELLVKAGVNGLGWERDSIELIFLSEAVSGTEESGEALGGASISEKVDLLCRNLKPAFIVVLGSQVASGLGLPEIALSQNFETRCLRRENGWCLLTADLASVAANAETKRTFWNDLKSISSRLKS